MGLEMVDTEELHSSRRCSPPVKASYAHCNYEECSATKDLEAHHIIPRSQGGGNTLENGITLCREHHRREFLRDHLHAQVRVKTSRLFSSGNTGKKEAAYRFLSRRRLIETARPHGSWRPDPAD